jgi:hypothetical protein
MQVTEFEEALWKIDHIRVVIRAPDDKTVQDFNWVKAADQGLRLSEYASTRIEPRLNGFTYEIIDGCGDFPNRNKRLGSLRQTYSRSE